MIDPKLAADMTDPQLAADSSEAALDAVPTPNTDETEPIEPMDRKLPTEPMLSTDPRLAMLSTEFCEAIDHFDDMEPRCHAGCPVGRVPAAWGSAVTCPGSTPPSAGRPPVTGGRCSPSGVAAPLRSLRFVKPR